jgi:hypothetical protein
MKKRHSTATHSSKGDSGTSCAHSPSGWVIQRNRARLADPADRYLQTWTRADDNPVAFVGAPIAFPGPIWRNGDHFNFVGQGNRFVSNDSTFSVPFLLASNHDVGATRQWAELWW